MAHLGHAVRDYRLQLMYSLMDREGFDALLFTQADFFQFATNFNTDVETWERPILCVVPRNGAPFVIAHELSTHHWRFTKEAGHLWIEDARFYAEHPRVQNRLPLVSQWSELVAQSLRDAGLHRSRIGVDAITAPLARVGTLLPSLVLQNATEECRTLRLVKHAEEIQLMREACALTDWLQDRYRENIRPGRLVQELDMSMAALFVEEAANRFPGEDVQCIEFFTLSGPASCAPHGDGRQCGARIEKGHGLVNIIIPRINGLIIENERTWFCGKPSARQVQLYEAAREANEAACEAAVTGNPVCAIDAAAQGVFERHGVADLIIHRTGHGLGLVGHEFPHDMAFNTRPLMSGEVYSAEPGIFQWGLGGFRIDDTVVIGDTPDILTRAPRDIPSQTIL